jgi:apolipoprotein D and lipocalin family protein
MKPILIIMTLCTFLQSCKTTSTLTTVNEVNIEKYSGLWYEIASYPTSFQKNCYCTTAEYTLSPKGFVIVENRCRKDSVTGVKTGIKGKAFVVKNSNNAKLKVQFFWPFKGKYWIISLADDYSWAVVSHPNRKYLWILSRTKTLDETTYNTIIELIKAKGLDPQKLKKTEHE